MKLYIALFLLLAPLAANSHYVVIHHHYNFYRGFFSIMDYVFGIIDIIEGQPEHIEDFEVDFECAGIYYDPEYGPNYWSYFFEPIKGEMPEGAEVIHIRSEWPKQSLFHNEKLDKFLLHERIQKYLHLKPELEQEIDDYVAENFSEKYMIGIHYRGTDKKYEADRVPYESVLKEIRATVDASPLNWHLFVATDEDQFLQTILQEFPGRVCYVDGVERSKNGKPIHFQKTDSPFLSGKYALMDCLLLSRVDFMLRTSSNLNRWSTYFNPWLPEKELSHRNFIY